MNKRRTKSGKIDTHINVFGKFVGYAMTNGRKVKVPVKETTKYYIDPAGMKFDKESGEVISWSTGDKNAAKHGRFNHNIYDDTYLIIETLKKDKRKRKRPGREAGTIVINGSVICREHRATFSVS